MIISDKPHFVYERDEYEDFFDSMAEPSQETKDQLSAIDIFPVDCCHHCKHFDKPPPSQCAGCATGACTHPNNIQCGPSGWGSATDLYLTVTDMHCCSNFERRKT